MMDAATLPEPAVVLPAAVERLQAGVAAALHYGAQLYVSLGGRTVADLAVGESRPGSPMSPELLLPWLSAAKPLTAAAVLQLAEAGRLDLDDPVALHLPEFGQGGKQGVTVRHLLTHTGGFRTSGIGGPTRDAAECLARIYATPLEPGWAPGERIAYQPASSWYVLGEVVRRVAGEPPGSWVRERIFAPLGMKGSWLTMPEATYPAWRPRLAPVYRTGARDAPGWEAGASASWRRFPWHPRRWATSPSPAEGGWGPARDLGRFYEMLLAGGAAPAGRVLSAAAVAAMIAPRPPEGGWDESLGRIVHWGLGLRINGRMALGAGSAASELGRHASPGSFGHGGFRSTLAFADPDHGLVVAMAFNSLPGACQHRRRTRGVVEAVYRDLGLAATDPPPLPPGWR
jgi:CubicO group peptidase (beta-lactamase class C family)